MLSRKKQKVDGIPLPDDWKKEILELINSIYQEKCDEQNMYFSIFGFTYPDELLFIVSLSKKDDLSHAPITYMASIDLVKSSKPKKLLNTLVDSIGIFFDSVFADSEWNDYTSKWEDAEFSGQKFFYKVSRENIYLTLEADKLLKSSE